MKVEDRNPITNRTRNKTNRPNRTGIRRPQSRNRWLIIYQSEPISDLSDALFIALVIHGRNPVNREVIGAGILKFYQAAPPHQMKLPLLGLVLDRFV